MTLAGGRAVLASTAVSYAGQVAGIAIGLLVAGRAGAEARGEYAVGLVALELGYGVIAGAVAESATFHARSERGRVDNGTATLAVALLPLGVVACVVAGLLPLPDGYVLPLCAYFLTASLVRMPALARTEVGLLDGGVYAAALHYAGGSVVALLVVASSLVVDGELSGAWVLGAVVGASILVDVVRLVVTFDRPRLRPDREMARRIYGYALRLAPAQWASFLNLKVDIVLLTLFVPVSDIGVYAVAVTLIRAPHAVYLQAARLFVPMESSAVARLRRPIALVVALSTAYLALLVLVGAPLLVRWLGSEFDDLPLLCLVLAPGAIALGPYTLHSRLASSWGFARALRVTEIVGLVVALAGLLVLAPLLGVVGAAVASSATYVLRLALLQRRVFRGGSNRSQD